MRKLHFYKMSACGNDFVVVDNRQRILEDTQVSDFVQKVCRRRISLGADGVIFLEESQTADFSMGFFNADGREVEMCGNGARCLARFAYLNGLCPNHMVFETQAGLIQAEVISDQVKLKLDYRITPLPSFLLHIDGSERPIFYLTVGVPHVVNVVEDIEKVDVIGLGQKIRFHDRFQPKGTNANFVKVIDSRKILIRTYERGVEDETLACGTGSIASSIVCALLDKVTSPVSVVTRSGSILKVYYQKVEKDIFQEIYLQGEARVVAEGNLWLEEIDIISRET